MYKSLVILGLLMTACLSVQAQCNVKRYTSSDNTVVREAAFEIVFSNVGESNNGDYSRGYTKCNARIARLSQSNPAVVLWELQVVTNASSASNLLVPRRIDFYFVNGSTASVKAGSFKEVSNNSFLCEFELDSQTRNILRNPLQRMEIIDSRKEEMYVATKEFGLYNLVLAEQLDCLQ
jgi:hypothetical protein